ncbi:nucleotidyl transferase AbiEii/AbiGii toxin family protein [Patescibacteria group bacterium]|nr:nucleotidyl transferase AbiEii/AbiGii toxin family protein [Patescibacteria group bacterium]
MITPSQVRQLSSQLGIDEFSIMREYLQLLVLDQLYQLKLSSQVYFKGGTAIRLLLGSARFSEDLDFDTALSKKELAGLIAQLEKEIQRELPTSQIILLHSGPRSIRYRLRYQDKEIKYPLVIRLDLGINEEPLEPQASALTTAFPIVIFPLINHQSPAEILAEKITALMSRGKGRDVFDLWYLLEQGIKIEPNLVQDKFKAAGIKADPTQLATLLAKRLDQFPPKKLEQDLGKFLPKDKKPVIELLVKRIKQHLVTL